MPPLVHFISLYENVKKKSLDKNIFSSSSISYYMIADSMKLTRPIQKRSWQSMKFCWKVNVQISCPSKVNLIFHVVNVFIFNSSRSNVFRLNNLDCLFFPYLFLCEYCELYVNIIWQLCRRVCWKSWKEIMASDNVAASGENSTRCFSCAKGLIINYNSL